MVAILFVIVVDIILRQKRILARFVLFWDISLKLVRNKKIGGPFIRATLIKGVVVISTKKEKSLVGKIGWCDAKVLGLKKGHYVFIRRVYGDKCSVNTFSSIKKKNGKYNFTKLDEVETGVLYSVPTTDLSLPRFSGVHNNVLRNIPLKSIEDIGKYSLRKRHHHYIQKHVKK